jgi:signal transduction histidine kinase
VIFRRAVLRLTLVYTSILLVLFGVFALAVYVFVTTTFDFDAVPTEEAAEPDAAEQGFAVLRSALLICYSALVLLIPPLSYSMARVALRPLRASYESQQRFVDEASHEFRTPLAVLQGEMELALSRDRDPAEYRRVLAGSLEVVGRLATLTGDLLLLARGDSAELSSSFCEVPLESVVRAAVDRQVAGDGRRATVTVEVERPVTVTGSPELLTRAVGNVVDNALKFTPPSGQVRVSVGDHSGAAVVRVCDTGVGMDAETVARAFDRFWRADEARAQPGYGLGLPLVEQICRAHGGTAAIAATRGVGTTVTLTLPSAR